MQLIAQVRPAKWAGQTMRTCVLSYMVEVFKIGESVSQTTLEQQRLLEAGPWVDFGDV